MPNSEQTLNDYLSRFPEEKYEILKFFLNQTRYYQRTLTERESHPLSIPQLYYIIGDLSLAQILLGEIEPQSNVIKRITQTYNDKTVRDLIELRNMGVRADEVNDLLKIEAREIEIWERALPFSADARTHYLAAFQLRNCVFEDFWGTPKNSYDPQEFDELVNRETKMAKAAYAEANRILDAFYNPSTEQ